MQHNISIGKTVIVVALEEEYTKADLYTGVGPQSAYVSMCDYLKNNEISLVINYGTCGSLKSELSGILQVTGYYDLLTDSYKGSWDVVCLTGDKFHTTTPKNFGDIVDCEAYYLKKACDEFNVEFDCYKYITDYVGSNSLTDWEEHLSQGSNLFDEILTDEKYR